MISHQSSILSFLLVITVLIETPSRHFYFLSSLDAACASLATWTKLTFVLFVCFCHSRQTRHRQTVILIHPVCFHSPDFTKRRVLNLPAGLTCTCTIDLIAEVPEGVWSLATSMARASIIPVPNLSISSSFVRREKFSIAGIIRAKKIASIIPCRGFTQLPECSITMTAMSANEMNENRSE